MSLLIGLAIVQILSRNRGYPQKSNVNGLTTVYHLVFWPARVSTYNMLGRIIIHQLLVYNRCLIARFGFCRQKMGLWQRISHGFEANNGDGFWWWMQFQMCIIIYRSAVLIQITLANICPGWKQPVHVDTVRQTCERTTAHHGARMAQIMLRNQKIGRTWI